MGISKEKDRDEFNPLRSILIDKHRPVGRSKEPKRGSRSVYMDLRILNGFSEYARYSGESMAWCLEEALIEYMRNHPLDRAVINITQDIRNNMPDVADRLKIKVVKSELGETLGLYKKIINNPNIPKSRVNEVRSMLVDCIRDALQLKTDDEEIQSLLEEVDKLL